MGLDFVTPVPQPPEPETDLRTWIVNFTAWLRTQEEPSVLDIESLIGANAPLASFLRGVEVSHTFVGPVVEDFLILAGPTTFHKRVILQVLITALGLGGPNEVFFELMHNLNDTTYTIVDSFTFNVQGNNTARFLFVEGPIVLDSPQESLIGRIVTTNYTPTFHVTGSYVDTD